MSQPRDSEDEVPPTTRQEVDDRVMKSPLNLIHENLKDKPTPDMVNSDESLHQFENIAMKNLIDYMRNEPDSEESKLLKETGMEYILQWVGFFDSAWELLYEKEVPKEGAEDSTVKKLHEDVDKLVKTIRSHRPSDTHKDKRRKYTA